MNTLKHKHLLMQNYYILMFASVYAFINLKMYEYIN